MAALTAFMDGIPAFDIFVIIFLLFMTFLGGIRGIFSQITSIVSLILSWYLASRYYSLAVPFIPLADPMRGTAAIFAVFILLAMVTRLISKMIGNVICGTVLKEVNRQMGALFGLIKGFVLCLVVTFFAVIASSQTRSFVLNSQSGRMMVRVISAVQEYIPDNEHHQKILEALKEFSEAAGDDAMTPTALEEQIASFKNEIEKKVQKEEGPKGAERQQTVDDFNAIAGALASFSSTSDPASVTNRPPQASQGGGAESIDGAIAAAQRIFSNASFHSRSLVAGENEEPASPRRGSERGKTASKASPSIDYSENSALSIIDSPNFSVSITAPPF